MRVYSDQDSVRAGEVTVLAVVETIITSSFAFGYAVATGYWGHILVATLVTPLILMRTDFASQLGARWLVGLERFFIGLYYHGPLPPTGFNIRRPVHPRDRNGMSGYFQAIILGFMLPILVPTFLIIVIPLVRFSAFLTGVATNPLGAIRMIPVNWTKIVVMADSFCVPEVIPGYEKEGGGFGFLSWTLVREFEESFVRIFYGLIILLVAMPYRISVKATCPFYIPFIYLESKAFNDKINFTQRLYLLKDDPLEKGARYYASFAFFCFYLLPASVMLALENGLVIVRDWLTGHLHAQVNLITIYTFVYRIETWHLTRLITIVLTLGLYFYVVRKLKEIELGIPIDHYRSGRTLSGLLYIRGFCSLYTIGCSIVLIWNNVRWPTIEWGGRIFPWQ